MIDIVRIVHTYVFCLPGGLKTIFTSRQITSSFAQNKHADMQVIVFVEITTKAISFFSKLSVTVVVEVYSESAGDFTHLDIPPPMYLMVYCRHVVLTSKHVHKQRPTGPAMYECKQVVQRVLYQSVEEVHTNQS